MADNTGVVRDDTSVFAPIRFCLVHKDGWFFYAFPEEIGRMVDQ
ncbi:MAG: hypothetical protein PHY28_10210 [Dehalococcoidales bacterium]|nr:hypothetical protein [Dehalococcoidales bacterium]